MVPALAIPIEVLSADGGSVRVNRRGMIDAPPVSLRLSGAAGCELITGWAGPWPLEERWWDATRSRRSARFQLLTESGSLLLACLERQQWWLLGDYC